MSGLPGEMRALMAGQESNGRQPAQRNGHAPAVPAVCRCHRPLTAPEGAHWWPSRDPEPDGHIRVVAVYGEDPGFLRRVRVGGGWRTHGAGACYTESSPPRPWAQLGNCWAGAQHPVVDVTGWDSVADAVSDSAEELAQQQQD